jgi:hypothetical protein
MTELYVYYRVKSANELMLQARVNTMQANLARTHGVAGLLKRRPEEKEGFHTWMEIYPQAPADFENLLDQAIKEANIEELIDGERRLEVFVDRSACA